MRIDLSIVSCEDDSPNTGSVVTSSNKDTPMDKELLISISGEAISSAPSQDDSEDSKASTSVCNEEKCDDEEECLLDDENSEDIENSSTVCDKVDSWNGRLVIVSNKDDSEERECVCHKDTSRGEG